MRFMPALKGTAPGSEGQLNAALTFLETVLRTEIQSRNPNIARVSIALGVFETPLTLKDDAARCFPSNPEIETQQLLARFDTWIDTLAKDVALETPTRTKVIAVAHAVWKPLRKTFAKDTPHVAQISVFAEALRSDDRGEKTTNAKRTLDCAGVVTTTFAACLALAARHGHDDLSRLCMELSEDHCWLNIGLGREDTIEVTTENAARRGEPVSAEAWGGWLYSQGHPTRLDSRSVLAAVVNAINPSITSRQRTGTDCIEMGVIQRRLLQVVDGYGLLYPAAIDTLADEAEVQVQDKLDEAMAKDDWIAFDAEEAQHGPTAKVCTLFQRARLVAAKTGDYQWYPYSYEAFFWFRRVNCLRQVVTRKPDDVSLRQRVSFGLSLAAAAAVAGGRVLGKYKYNPQVDEELFRDLEGLLETWRDTLVALSKLPQLDTETMAADRFLSLLNFLDSLRLLFDTQGLPSQWIPIVATAARCFPPTVRQSAVSAMKPSTAAMVSCVPLWGPLKTTLLRDLLAAPKVGTGGNSADGVGDGTGRRDKRARTK